MSALTEFPYSISILVFNGGYSEEFEPGILRSEMESGIVKQSFQKTKTMCTRTLTYAFCSKENYQSFKNWYFNDIKRGALFFLWRDPVDNVDKRARIVGGEIKTESTKSDLTRWEVSFKLETWT